MPDRRPRCSLRLEASGAGNRRTLGPAGERLPDSGTEVEYQNREAGLFDARDELAGIPVRSLVIAGRHDMLPPERVKALADGLPSATFRVFEASGHFAPVEEPQAFKKAVYDFLGVPAPAGP